MSKIKDIQKYDKLLESLKELSKEISKKGFSLYLLMHTLSENDSITLAGFYKEDENIVKTASFTEKGWVLSEEDDQIISNEKPSEIELNEFLSINEIIKMLSDSDENFERYTKIIASLSKNRELNVATWNILAFLENSKVNNIKVNASNGEIISNENLDLIRKL